MIKHLRKGRKFHRKKGQRRAFLKSLMNNLIINEKIETTEARAKEIKSRTEKLVTIAKKQTLPILRILASRLSKKAAYKIFHQIAPRYKDAKGGYLRIVKSAKRRKNDSAKMANIEFV